MTFYSGRRVLVTCLVAAVVTVAAGLSGLDLGQFIAGVLGGGALTGVFLTVRNRSR